MASKGYPKSYEKGKLIKEHEGIHMGTTLNGTQTLTDGGRVLLVIGQGVTLKEAKESAYKKVASVECSNLFFRSDIGDKSIKNQLQ